MRLKEFAPSPERDDNDDVPDQLLVLANRWWNATDRQPQNEHVLNSLGWSIHQVESEDDAVQLQHRDGTTHFISADDFDVPDPGLQTPAPSKSSALASEWPGAGTWNEPTPYEIACAADLSLPESEFSELNQPFLRVHSLQKHRHFQVITQLLESRSLDSYGTLALQRH